MFSQTALREDLVQLSFPLLVWCFAVILLFTQNEVFTRKHRFHGERDLFCMCCLAASHKSDVVEDVRPGGREASRTFLLSW